jgi:tetratricopeptide (TPR) repeat protein
MHLLGNMLFLWIFGNAVCDRMGGLSYLLFYLAGGVAAGVGFAYGNDNQLIGASGAIAAVTTAFLALFPRVHVTLLLWFFIVTMIQLPAMAVIVFKIILWDNIVAPRLEQGMVSNVAYSAHLAGYAFGFAVAMGMLAVRALPRNNFDMLGLLDRRLRRSGIDADVLARPAVRPTPALPVEPRIDEHERLREDIVDRIYEHDLAEAARLYRELRQLRPDLTLPHRQQLEIANYLSQTQRQAEAADAYEAFLAAYPSAADADQVRLLLGLVCNRHLHDRPRAARHLRAALQGLTNADQRQLALDELARAETGDA